MLTEKAEEARDAALEALTRIVGNIDYAVEHRIEAAKIILNRPRYFVNAHDKEE